MFSIKVFKEKEQESYKDSKEYLERQQKIDSLLVFAKLLEPGMSVNKGILSTVNDKIASLIESIK